MKRLCTVIATALAAACAGGSASVGATRAWTSNYVASVVTPIAIGAGDPAAVSNLVRDVMAEVLNSSVATMGGYEDDMTATTDGRVAVYVAVSYRDSVVLERREFSVSAVQTNTPPCLGCRVVSSALADTPTGTLYAVAADGLRVRNVNAAQPEFEIYSTTNGWRLYGVGDGATYDSVDIFDGGRVRVGAWTNGVLRGTFTLQPWALTKEEASACLGGEPSGYSAWADLATNRAASVTIAFSEELDADETGGSGGGVTFDLNYHGPGYVDYEELWPTDEEHYWSPQYGLMPGTWEGPANWIAFPLTVSITYDDAGETRTRTDIISSWDQLNRLLNRWNIGLNVPPFPYNYPVLKKRVSFECLKFGHVWRMCECTVCGETREHDFAFAYAGGKSCARCKNKNTARRRTDDGEWEVYDLDTTCGRYDEQGILSFHAGWHHETMPGEEADSEWLTFCCSCQCGCFSPGNIPLSHALDLVDGNAQPYDDTTHKVLARCSRPGCGFITYKLEHHEEDTSDESLVMTYYDEESHVSIGTCSKCGGSIYGKVRHLWGYFGDGMDVYCSCPCFSSIEDMTLLHTAPTAMAYVNPFDGYRSCPGSPKCDRCGINLDPPIEEFYTEHLFGYPTAGAPDGETNDSYHYCACGTEVEPHDEHYFDALIGVCEICGLSRSGDDRGGLDGNGSGTTKDPSSNDPTPTGGTEGGTPVPPWRPPWPSPEPGPDPDPVPPDPGPPGPVPPIPEPPFPPVPPDIPVNGGNSSVTVDPNSNTNNVPWRVYGGNNVVFNPRF